jgi:hypothetical protein
MSTTAVNDQPRIPLAPRAPRRSSARRFSAQRSIACENIDRAGHAAVPDPQDTPQTHAEDSLSVVTRDEGLAKDAKPASVLGLDILSDLHNANDSSASVTLMVETMQTALQSSKTCWDGSNGSTELKTREKKNKHPVIDYVIDQSWCENSPVVSSKQQEDVNKGDCEVPDELNSGIGSQDQTNVQHTMPEQALADVHTTSFNRSRVIANADQCNSISILHMSQGSELLKFHPSSNVSTDASDDMAPLRPLLTEQVTAPAILVLERLEEAGKSTSLLAMPICISQQAAMYEVYTRCALQVCMRIGCYEIGK